MAIPLDSFNVPIRAAIVGATGGLGSAFVKLLVESGGVGTLHALSRNGAVPVGERVRPLQIDYDRPESIADAAREIGEGGPLDLVIVATGLLHDDHFGPEKSLRDLDADQLARSFQINTIGPALIARHFLPLTRREGKTVFAALSARVGSISDNRIGGWHGYRSAKAALNMMLKNFAIEHKRRWPESAVIGLHPGTVDTGLSKPFQKNVPQSQLFDPEYSAGKLLAVIDGVKAKDSGKVFAYDGSVVPE